MADAKIISANRELFRQVRILNLPFGEYALFGSAPLGVRGLKECQDMDIIVSPAVFDRMRAMPGWKAKHTVEGNECLSSGAVEIWKTLGPGTWDVKQLIADAEVISGLPFVKLEHVLAWKKLLQRDKDAADIAAIEHFLGKWQFYETPPEAWAAMLQDCREAQATIDIESYIFLSDAIGIQFLDVFKNQVKQGVRVRILCDMVGSYGFFNSAQAKECEALGIEVRFFNPVQPWRIGKFLSYFHRDHRKVLIVDSRIGYTGGVNIANYMYSWRDTHARFEGTVVSEMKYAFERMWVAAHAKKILRKFKKPLVIEPNISFITSAPHWRQRFVYKNMLQALRRARRYAYFATPYFVPSIRLFSALIAAAKRKVDIRILLPEKSDVRTIDIAAGAYFTLALKSGIKIYRYTSSVLHVKTAIIDAQWGTVGSVNLDNVSLLSNYEGNVVTKDKNFIEELKVHFLHDITAAVELNYDTWVRRPLLQKTLEVITWPIHRIL